MRSLYRHILIPGRLRHHGGSYDAEHVEVTSATVVAAAMEPLTAMQRLCMRASLRRRLVAARKRLPEGRAGFKRATQQQHFRGVMRFLRIRKSLRRHPVTCIRPGKGNVGTRRKINLTTMTGSPAGAMQSLSQCAVSV